MNATTQPTTRELLGTELRRGVGLQGRVGVFWTMAGGILLGGVLVALMTLSGQLSGHGLFMTASGLFVIGAVLGLAHGMVLGFFGRPETVSSDEAWKNLGLTVLYAIPAAALAWLVTVWIAMTMVAGYLDRLAPSIGVGMAWSAGAVVVAAAGVYGWRALAHAYARWPERRAGTVLVATSFAALLVLFLADRPMIWGLRMQVTAVGAVILAALLAIWVAGPAVTLALKVVRRLPRPRPSLGFGRAWGLDLALGLVLGLVLGLIAVPFAVPGIASTGTGGAVLIRAASQALVDEVLLRLVLLTAVAWLLFRWHRINRTEAVVGSVAIATLVQLALYTPGVLATGFATPMAAIGFVVAAVIIPGTVFGVLYWLRGFGTALVADATWVAALTLLAV